jgi:hypothetical protein
MQLGFPRRHGLFGERDPIQETPKCIDEARGKSIPAEQHRPSSVMIWLRRDFLQFGLSSHQPSSFKFIERLKILKERSGI